MSVTDQLLVVFRVERQIRGLTGRLGSAEAFYQEQARLLKVLETKHEAVKGQLRQLTASIANEEVEIKSLDEKIEKLRDQMNNAKTNREYKAFLTELSTFKADRDRIEEGTLEHLSKSDEIKAQLDDIDNQIVERTKVKQIAAQDRTAREEEIRDQLAELKEERLRVVQGVSQSALDRLEALLESHEEDAMAPIEIQDRRRKEFTCGGCMMNLPIEAANALLSHGGLTQCTSCGCLLYVEGETADAFNVGAKK